MEKVAEFLKKYWYIVLGVLILIPFLYKYFSKFFNEAKAVQTEQEVKASNIENAIDSPVIQLSKAEAVFKKHKTPLRFQAERLTNAKQFAHNLGVNYSWYDPQGWTENDEDLGKLLKRQGNNLDVIAELYFSVITQGHNLKTDLLKHLDDDVLKSVRNSWKANKVPQWL